MKNHICILKKMSRQGSLVPLCWLMLIMSLYSQDDQQTRSFPSSQSSEIQASEIQAVTLKREKIDEQILNHFLKQLASAAFGNYGSSIMTDSAAFDVFYRNYNYNPERLIKEIPLVETQSIVSIVKATLAKLQPHSFSSILTSAGDYFLYCKTIRGPRILTLTRHRFSETFYEEEYEGWYLSVLSPEIFTKNLLLNVVYFDAVRDNHYFIQDLIGGMSVLESSYYAGFSELNRLFFETTPLSGYDVASITQENRYFPERHTCQRQLNFLSLPVVQYTVLNNEFKDYYFMVEEPSILDSLKIFLEKYAHSSKGSSAVYSQLNTFISCIQAHSFDQKTFMPDLQDLFEELNYSINYDAIGQNKKDEVFHHLKIFLFSNGIADMNELKTDKAFIEKIIEKFFVLGTTYFYRCWSNIAPFENYLDAIKEKAEKQDRPVKLKVFACSTGEEVLTYAFTLIDKGITRFTILGSDINAKFIETAQTMTYSRESFERLPEGIRRHILRKYFSKTPDGYEIKDKDFFSKRVFYKVLDITHPLPRDLPEEIAPPYDLISCQNIFLYLNPDIVPDLYHSILKMLADQGLYILVDKYCDHYSLEKRIRPVRKLFHINKYMVQVHSKNYPQLALISKLKKINKDDYSFESLRQYDEISGMSADEKKAWYSSLLKMPGNREMLILLASRNLINSQSYQEADQLLHDGIYQYPYLLDNYIYLKEVQKKLNHPKEAEYLRLIISAINLIYNFERTESISQFLSFFKQALELQPDELLGYYSLGYQLLRHAIKLKQENAFLVDYELFLNQAFKNLSYVQKKDPKNVYVGRGIAEIALTLYPYYIREQNHDIADRLIYNALVHYESIARNSTNFSVLYNLGQLQLRMGASYLSYQLSEKAYDIVLRALTSMDKALTNSKNITYIYLYRYHVDYAELWLNLYKILKKLPLIKRELSPAICLGNAMKSIDKALMYNSVYGIEAIEMRNQILMESASLKEDFEKTFNCE
ncbi:MAG: hypothetical protein JW774_11790 [Candidatus Aureabacteria bacterium]|nr:hypothetical protein [Candidatus Auribacterota bacterium]